MRAHCWELQEPWQHLCLCEEWPQPRAVGARHGAFVLQQIGGGEPTLSCGAPAGMGCAAVPAWSPGEVPQSWTACGAQKGRAGARAPRKGLSNISHAPMDAVPHRGGRSYWGRATEHLSIVPGAAGSTVTFVAVLSSGRAAEMCTPRHSSCQQHSAAFPGISCPSHPHRGCAELIPTRGHRNCSWGGGSTKRGRRVCCTVLRLLCAVCCVCCVCCPAVCPGSAPGWGCKAPTEMGPKSFLSHRSYGWGPKGSERRTQPYMGDLALMNAWGL